ncbi:hypothetical protein [Micromonospora sp. CPCC 206061]|uniref:hypothetical protein n=1 Tax=Micromonospora sp. CPCC 206061 TaxID=3122410 RepID=UPI002FF349C1
MVEDDGGGGGSYTPAPTEYESFSDAEDVRVKVTDLVTYWEEMTNLSMDAFGAYNTVSADMKMMVVDGLTTPRDGQTLPEGLQAARFLENRMSDFSYFMRDVTEGVRNIGGAAAVIAEMFENSDNSNGADINDIGFVFGDPNVSGPRGFRDTETYYEWQQRMAEESGMNAQALTGNDEFAKVTSYPYGAIYTFGDGSKKHVHSTTEYGANGLQTAVTTTYIYGADGKLISTQVERNTYNDTGQTTTRSTSTTTGEGDDQRQTTSTTTENPNGSVTVRTETQTGDGEPTVSESTVQRDDHRETSGDAPVHDASEKLDSDGKEHTVHDYGVA